MLQTSPLTNADLQHAIGRGMRGVTAIKRMMALGYATALLERLQADSELVKARLGLSFPKRR